jgi:GNAT superfamily N-acetyltransferase
MAPGKSLNKVTVRPLAPGDFIDVATCCNDLAPMIPGFEKDVQARKMIGVVACDEMDIAIGAAVGSLDVDASLAENPLPLPCVRLHFIEVSNLYRGKGVGKLLMENFIQQQKSKNIACLTASLFKTFPGGGAAFLEKFGFRKEGSERNKISLKLNLWSDFGVIDMHDDDIS